MIVQLFLSAVFIEFVLSEIDLIYDNFSFLFLRVGSDCVAPI